MSVSLAKEGVKLVIQDVAVVSVAVLLAIISIPLLLFDIVVLSKDIVNDIAPPRKAERNPILQSSLLCS
jgi:hypothetical protein